MTTILLGQHSAWLEPTTTTAAVVPSRRVNFYTIMDRPAGHEKSPDSNEIDLFVHNIAIKLSRALNIVNPNDLLARRVIDIVKSNTPEGFIKGAFILRFRGDCD